MGSISLNHRPQVAVISNPAPFHIDVALPLAESSVHLLIEKPVSTTRDGVSKLIEDCRRRNITLMVGYNLRVDPCLQKYRELIRADFVGRVLSVRAEVGQYLPSWRPGSDYRDTVTARADLGGGVLFELSHEIDYLQWIFGDAKSVYASLSKQSDLDINVEDTAHMILEFGGDHNAIPSKAVLSIDCIRQDRTRNCVAIGDKGSLRWNALVGTVDCYEPGSDRWQPVFESPHQRNDSYIEEWVHFLRCIEGNASPLITGEDGLAVLKVIEAARESSRIGMQVSIA